MPASRACSRNTAEPAVGGPEGTALNRNLIYMLAGAALAVLAGIAVVLAFVAGLWWRDEPAGEGARAQPPAAGEKAGNFRATLNGESPPNGREDPADDLLAGTGVGESAALPGSRDAAFAGTVRDVESRAIRDASVRFEAIEGGERNRFVIYTDAGGRFRSGAIGASQLDRVAFDAPGFRRLEMEQIPLPLTDLAVTLESEANVRLRVRRQGGEPVQGDVTVYVLRRLDDALADGPAQPNVPRDEFVAVDTQGVRVREGAGDMSITSPGLYRLLATVASDFVMSTPFQIEAGGGAEVELVLGVAGVAGGVVVDAVSGAPIPGARAWLLAAGLPDVSGLGLRLESRTDREGRFRFDAVPAGAYRLVAGADGYTTATRSEIEMGASGVEGLEVALQPGATGVVIVVIDATRRPVPGARLVLFGGGEPPVTRFGETDASGTSRFGDLEPGTYSVTVTQPGADRRQAVMDFTVQSGQRLVEVRFESLVRVSGTVSGPSGAYAGDLVFIRRSPPVIDYGVSVEPSGAFALEMEAGEYNVAVPGGGPVTTVVVEPGPSAFLTISLRESDAAGATVPVVGEP